ncbi:universal stress protein [Methylobacterium aquaticum]|uniref:universal stress protein n=1 Tax=Methylobacterium aquaticum TaxID=270351 RepID=UPI000ADD471D|nr:universal stress protein [Methylobacterium aquaticum]
MFLRCLLVPTAPGLDPTRRLDAALRLSRRLHAHIGVGFIAPGPELVLAALAGTAPVSSATVAAIREGTRAAAAEGRAALQTWCAREGVPFMPAVERLDATFATWTESSGEVERVLTLAGRVADLVVVDRPDPDIPFTGRALDTALFSVGRPTLMVGEAVPHDLLDHVVVAWNGSLEGTRLIGQSIALLHAASRVTLVQVRTGRAEEAKAADLCAHVRWHGIVAEPSTLAAGEGRSVGSAILDAAERGAPPCSPSVPTPTAGCASSCSAASPVR